MIPFSRLLWCHVMPIDAFQVYRLSDSSQKYMAVKKVNLVTMVTEGRLLIGCFFLEVD